MKASVYLERWLEENASAEHYLFSFADLRVLFPTLPEGGFRTLLSRAVSGGTLLRVCRGLYGYKKAIPRDGLLLFHVAAYVRANAFNYISLESVLSEAGVISQVTMNWVSIMSSGRSNKVSCGEWGTIEFIHTSNAPAEVMEELSYDSRCGLWRASVGLALRDMKRTQRNCDLINWEIANEFIR